MEVLREHGFSVIGRNEKMQVWRYYVNMVETNMELSDNSVIFYFLLVYLRLTIIELIKSYKRLV